MEWEGAGLWAWLGSGRGGFMGVVREWAGRVYWCAWELQRRYLYAWGLLIWAKTDTK